MVGAPPRRDRSARGRASNRQSRLKALLPRDRHGPLHRRGPVGAAPSPRIGPCWS